MRPARGERPGRDNRLGRGDRLPSVAIPPPGPRSQEISSRAAAHEAPGISGVPAAGATLVWEAARGANVLDADGNVYIDLTSGFGVAAVGHRHPRVVAAVRGGSERLLHGLGDVHSHPLRTELAARLAELVPVRGASEEAGPGGTDPEETDPVDPPQVHFGISGAEAVEIAVKTALLAGGRPDVVAFEPSYHGLTLGALALTSRPGFRRPFAARLGGEVHRLPYGGDPADLGRLLAERTGGGRCAVGCLVYEPIVGREGVVVPPPGWLGEITRICRRHQVLTIADEVFTGFGRTGAWFAVEHDLEADLLPDLLVCGKALGGGLPIAAAVGRRSLMAGWRTAGEALHTATFVAHPLACAAALATLDVLATDRLPERAARHAPALERRLAGWPDRFPAVTATRGRGLLHAFDLRDRDRAARLVTAARARGLLLLAGGPEGRVAQLVPPLTITSRQLDHALGTLEEILADL